MTRDGNPSYWDPHFATERWGGIVAPPAMLETWLMPLEWSPWRQRHRPRLPARIPLPGRSMINGGNDAVFHREVRVGGPVVGRGGAGECLRTSSRRGLGDGHFVETLSVFSNQDGAVVAEVRNTLFRFTPRDGT